MCQNISLAVKYRLNIRGINFSHKFYLYVQMANRESTNTGVRHSLWQMLDKERADSISELPLIKII